MVWTSGWKLAAAVCDAGGLGVIGAGSLAPELLREHLVKMKAAVGTKDFAVNLPLFYHRIQEQIDLLLEFKVPIVITSAGSPKTYTQLLRANGIKVFHVVSSLAFALKSQEAGVDAVIAEGFEAGGHNGREETTTMVLLQELRGNLSIPYIAAGGIGSGYAMAAAMCMGAVAVQVGSLFVATEEASTHVKYKELLKRLGPGSTKLSLKKLMPVRLIKNTFFEKVKALEENAASAEELQDLLGKGRSKRGMFEGDLENGELEIGQVVSLINEIRPAKSVLMQLITEFRAAQENLASLKF